jgi:hypothetical protein
MTNKDAEILIGRLLNSLTLDQIEQVVDCVDEVIYRTGHGEVTIIIKSGHVRLLRVSSNIEFHSVLRQPFE